MIQSQLSSAVAIPVTKVMLEAAKSSWEKPSSVPISSKRLDHMYHTQKVSAGFLFHHPPLNSLVVSSSSKCWHQHSTPSDKKGKMLDLFGRHLYSARALSIKCYNYMTCIARFIYAVLEDLAPYLNTLTEDQWLGSCQRKDYFSQAYT